MNLNGPAQFVTLWVFANAAAALFLAVASYFSAKWSLDALAAFDQWLSRQEHKRGSQE